MYSGLICISNANIMNYKSESIKPSQSRYSNNIHCFSRADFFEDEAVEQILQYNPWWTDTYSKMMAFMGKSQEQENHAALGKKLKNRLFFFTSS